VLPKDINQEGLAVYKGDYSSQYLRLGHWLAGEGEYLNMVLGTPSSSTAVGKMVAHKKDH